MPFFATLGANSTRSKGMLLPSVGFAFYDNVTANFNNYNVRSKALAAGWNGISILDAVVQVNSNITIGSNFITTPAFDTGVLSTNSYVTLINAGNVVGAGGNGGAGAGNNGANGGQAINFQSNGIIINNSIIGGGGGGGGGGGNYISGATSFLGGSGGGGGAGQVAGTGGTPATGTVLNGNPGIAGTLLLGGVGGSSASVEAPSSYSLSVTTTLFAYQNNLTYTVTLDKTSYTGVTLNIPFVSTIGGISSGSTNVTVAPGTNSATVTVIGAGATSGGTYTTVGNTQSGLSFTGNNISVTMFPLLGRQSAAGCYSAQGGLALEVDGSGFIQLRMGNWPTDPPNCQTCDWNWLRNNFATNTTRNNNNTRPYWTHTWSFRVDDIAVGNSSDTRDPQWPYTLVAYTYRVTRTATNSISVAVFPNSWGTGDSGTSISVSNWWNNVNNISPIVFTW